MAQSARDWMSRATLLAAVIFLGILALRPYLAPDLRASADAARFDYLYVISPMYLYRGGQGVLLLDKRNGNVWFVQKTLDMDLSFKDPVFVVHLPLEKLDQATH